MRLKCVLFGETECQTHTRGSLVKQDLLCQSKMTDIHCWLFWSNGLHCENPNNPVLFETSFWLTEKKGSGGQ